nr:PREDICTED: uncharacterized protein LOC109036547 [Bemisia tabaci]
MGETRSNPMKSFDTSVARPIIISTEDLMEPDSNSTSDKELTTRSGRWGMSWFKNWRSAPRSPKPPKEEKRGKCRRRCKKAAKVLFASCFCCCLNLLCPDDDQVDRAQGRPPRPRT